MTIIFHICSAPSDNWALVIILFSVMSNRSYRKFLLKAAKWGLTSESSAIKMRNDLM